MSSASNTSNKQLINDHEGEKFHYSNDFFKKFQIKSFKKPLLRTSAPFKSNTLRTEPDLQKNLFSSKPIFKTMQARSLVAELEKKYQSGDSRILVDLSYFNKKAQPNLKTETSECKTLVRNYLIGISDCPDSILTRLDDLKVENYAKIQELKKKSAKLERIYDLHLTTEEHKNLLNKYSVKRFVKNIKKNKKPEPKHLSLSLGRTVSQEKKPSPKKSQGFSPLRSLSIKNTFVFNGSKEYLPYVKSRESWFTKTINVGGREVGNCWGANGDFDDNIFLKDKLDSNKSEHRLSLKKKFRDSIYLIITKMDDMGLSFSEIIKAKVFGDVPYHQNGSEIFFKYVKSGNEKNVLYILHKSKYVVNCFDVTKKNASSLGSNQRPFGYFKNFN